MWVSAAFATAGLVLVAFSVALALRQALRAIRPGSWHNRWRHQSYVTFAWQELGRGVFYGYLFALGMTPITAFFFLGNPYFWSNFLFFSLVIWASSAIIMYFMMVLPGLFGFVTYRRAVGNLKGWNLYAQVLVVGLLSAPFGYLLGRFLLQQADSVIGLLVETLRLYGRLFA